MSSLSVSSSPSPSPGMALAIQEPTLANKNEIQILTSVLESDQIKFQALVQRRKIKDEKLKDLYAEITTLDSTSIPKLNSEKGLKELELQTNKRSFTALLGCIKTSAQILQRNQSLLSDYSIEAF